MKTFPSLTGPALAALGISLMAISCDNKSEEADLEGRVIGYWAPDAEAMMKEKGPAEEDSIEALRTEMLAAMTFEIPEKGKIVMHMMGDSLNMSYTVKTIDEATKTLSVEITDPDGGTESGSFIIGEDKLKLSTGGDEPDLSLVRIDEAAFKKRKVVLPNTLDLPEGPDPEEGDTTEPANTGNPANPEVVLETSSGTIVLELDPENAPLTTENFLTYVNDGFYDGTIFHRVIDDFMIQGGGFELIDGSGTEKETRDPVKNEAKNGLRNTRGTISMARTNNPDSATSQFFINLVDNPGLDPKTPENPRAFSPDGYTVFGKVTKGMDVVDKIRGVDTGVKRLKARGPGGDLREAPMQDVPLQNVIIEKATASQSR